MTVYQAEFISKRMEVGYLASFKGAKLLQRQSYPWKWLDVDCYNDIFFPRS